MSRLLEWIKGSPSRAILIGSGLILLAVILVFKFVSSGQNSGIQQSKTSYEKSLGNNREAVETAQSYMDMWSKIGRLSKWRVDLKPSETGDNLDEYRKQVTNVNVAIELVGAGIDNWKARKNRASLLDPQKLDQETFVEYVIKKLRGENYSGKTDNNGYINADIVVKIKIKKKEVAVGTYNVKTGETKVKLL
ncbi:MAG: hypothetical protein HY776_00040 [Actinobacteria bacterium]|nr:hypothetical protein [Actinomycetota bacterium]